MSSQEAPKETKLSWQEMIVEKLKNTTDGFVEVGSAEVYAVASESDPQDFYYVLVTSSGILCAKCKGFRFRGACRHTDLVMKKLGVSKL
jgi:hypothetical protein